MQESEQARVAITELAPRHEQEWRQLWQGYLEFYKATLAAEITDHTWMMLVGRDSATVGLAAELQGELVGFAHAIIHPRTWSMTSVAYLEDLFVRPDCRAHGIGRALIENLVARGRQSGWSSIYWHTAADNRTARLLYDSFAIADDFVRYRMLLS